MPKVKQDLESGFRAQLTSALKHFTQPRWLGDRSPLASPYFLGGYLQQQPSHTATQAVGRGKALQSLLRHTCTVMAEREESEGAELARLLDLTYFQLLPEHDILRDLSISRSTYFNYRTKAMHVFEDVLIKLHSPALHLEFQTPPPLLTGRQDAMRRCITALRKHGSVGVIGPSGIGKTAFAAAVVRQLAPQPVFWYTFRTGLNDRLYHLLFALAYFMQEHGAPNLWMQLVADRGEMKMEVIEGVLRHELKALADLSPVLCFDEVDLLNPAGEAHARLLSFIATLGVDAAVLLLGRNLPIQTLQAVELAELDSASIGEVLDAEQIKVSDEDLLRIKEFTRGNPRLLQLFVALHTAGEPLSNVLAQITRAPSLEGILNRILHRLPDEELLILAELSVYRSPAPASVWAQQQRALQKLVAQQLVQEDGRGGVSLLPAYKEFIYAGRSPEVRAKLHLDAAWVRANMAERTAAAYHCICANRPDLAVTLWYPHRQSEINQGQAEAAYAVFDGIALNQVRPTVQKLLMLIRSELKVLRGAYEQARDALGTASWDDDVLSARRSHLRGDIAEVTGELDLARLAYHEGLGTVENMRSKELIRLRLDLGWVDRRQANFSRAWQETQVAEYETEDLRGDILRDQSQFAEAKTHYERAIALAGETGNLLGLANTHNALAAILAQQGFFVEADEHWETAANCFKKIGKLTRLPSVRANQATSLMLAEQYEKSVEYAQEALSAFETFAEPYGIAVAAHTLAESYLGLRQLDLAEQYVGRVLSTEESRVIPDALRVLAEITFLKHGPATALPICRQSIAETAAIRDFYIEGQCWRLLGRLYHALGEHDSAIAAIRKAIDIFGELDLATELERSRNLLGQLYPGV